MDKLTQLRTEQGDIQSKLDALATTLETEKRGMTAEEKTTFDGWKARMAEIAAEAKPLAELQEMRGKQIPFIPGPVANDSHKEYEKELRNYSLLNVIQARHQGNPLTGREAEFAQEVVKRNAGNGATVVGPYGIPSEVFSRDYTATGTTSTTGDQGGDLIETTKPGLIEALAPYMILDKMGVTKLNGLKGNLSLPRETSAAPSATFKAETTAAADQSGLFDNVDLSPKRLPGYINYTHQMLIQPTVAMEGYVRQRLLQSIANKVQSAYFIGTGSSNEPTGVLTSILATGWAGTGGQVVETAGTLDWDSIVDLESLVDSLDALQGSLGYVTNARMKGKLKTTTLDTGSGLFLWNMMNNENPVNAYPCWITNQIPNTAGTSLTNGTNTPIAFGNWADTVLANWGDLFFDTVNANAGSGYYQLVVNSFWDVAVLRTKSLSMAVDIATTTSFGS